MVLCVFFFMMQAGFAFMASGAAHEKNASTVLTNQGLVICTVSIVFLIIGDHYTTNANGGLAGTPFEPI